MWRLIKWTVILVVIGGGVLWLTDYKWRGRTIKEHLKPIAESGFMKEAVRDLRSLVGEGLRTAGEMISEDVTDSERRQLEDVLRRELGTGKSIEGAQGQKALPPITKETAKDSGEKPDLSKMVDKMLKDRPEKTAEEQKAKK